MDKEQILEASRREHNNRDLAELELTARAGSAAGRVGACVCCLVSLIFHRFTNTLLCSPWVIYFSILATHELVKYGRQKKRSGLFLAAVYVAMCLLALFFFVRRLVEIGG